MSSDKMSITKLQGIANYETWALRVDAYLIREAQRDAITSEVNPDLNDKALANIRLLLGDGPLLQIQHISNAKKAWESLKNLYSPRGFTSEFLICREFFEATLNKYSSMEEYLNKVKQLSDQLKAKNLTLPKQVIIAWVLNNLTDNYDGFVSNITQSLRNDSDAYSLETLFSNLLDESKRQESRDTPHILYTKAGGGGYKGKKPYKITKGKHCKYCKLPSHEAKDCYFLFPNKAPKNWKNLQREEEEKKEIPKHSRDQRDENVDILFTKESSSSNSAAASNSASNSGSDFELDLDLDMDNITFEDVQVFITNTPIEKTNLINNSDLESPTKSFHTKRNNKQQVIKSTANLARKPNTNFILDCAATKNIIASKEFFSEFHACNKIVRWGNAKSITVKGYGNVYVQFKDTKIKHLLRNCLYMPELGINLISQSELPENVYSIITFDSIYLKKKNSLLTKGKKINNLYYLPVQVLKIRDNNHIYNTIALNYDPNIIWHQRLGHISQTHMAKLNNSVLGVEFTKTPIVQHVLDNCEICIQAKFTNQINHKTNNIQELQYLDKIASDLCGQITPSTYDRYKYFITFLDKATKFLEVKLLRTKDEAYEAFYEFKQRAENNKNNYKIRTFVSDNGGEFVNKRFQRIFTENGIVHQLCAPYTKEQNGFIERINRTLFNKIRALLYNANLPSYLWGEALTASVYIYNRTPHSAIEFKTPYEMKFKNKPDISNIRIFGSIAYYKNKTKTNKLEPKANKGILIGYGSNQYRIWDLENKKPVWSRDVKILEGQFLLPTINNTAPQSNEDSVIIENHSTNSTTTIANPIAEQNEIDEVDQIQTHNNNNNNNNIPDNIYDDSIDELALVTINNEPTTYKQAMNHLDSDKWQDAMQTEIDELHNQNTWDLVDLPENKTPLKGRWVYTHKTNSEGQIIKYKARWVIKGFNQVLGVDYVDTYSSTCRPETYRIAFILAVSLGWNLYQYDIKNAFVHAKIDKEIYTEQPTGFNNNSNKVCKLNKALYGLKQSPRLWYKHLSNIFKKLDFQIFAHDEAAFIHAKYSIIIICHVDDLIITGPNKNQIDEIINKITKQLKLQYIGEINQFLGMEFTIDKINKSMYIHQTKYLNNIKTRFNTHKLTPVSTPVELGIKLEKSQEEASQENILSYQQQVGALSYLANKTRPDISFAVNRCARYTKNPNHTHFRALNRIWKYLNHNTNLGVTYTATKSIKLIGYTDADWGGDDITRKSTTGYVFLLGQKNIISWNSMLQKTTALSSCEAEYMALKESAKESIYLNNMIKEFAKLIKLDIENMVLFTDSESAMKLGENAEFHKRSKHIDIQYHFVRECIEEKKIILAYIPTKRQLADGFTKGLDNNKQKLFITGMGLQ
jgi:hypothetical protein